MQNRPAVGDASTFDDLWDLLSRTAGKSEVTPDTVCRVAVNHLNVAAAVVTVPDGLLRAQTIGAHGLHGRRLEELQVTVGEGPSLEGLTSALPLLVEDIALPEYAARWPLFVAAVAVTEIRSVSVLPMRAGGARFGVLTLYLARPGGLDADRAIAARTFGRITMELLLGYMRAAHPDGNDPSGDRLFNDRPEIHQATGMVSAQLEVDPATALLRLRGRAFAEGRLLSEIAADVVHRRARFDGTEYA
jgi:GAF domain-containing protein